MKIFNKIYEFVVGLNDHKFKKNIERLNKSLDNCKNDREKLNNMVDNFKKEIEHYEKEVEDLQEKNKKLQDVINDEIIKLDDVDISYYFNKIDQTYTWKPGKTVNLRETLNNFSEDTEYQQKYRKWLNDIGVKNQKNVDFQVYHTAQKVLNFIANKRDSYDKDQQSFNTSEYWLSPQEAFDYYVEENDVGDCEDTSAILYGAIVTKLLDNGFGDELWRLKRVDVIIDGSGGHALVAWLKESLTWSPIESTFVPDRFRERWYDDVDIFKSMYADVWHIFDEESEYSLK